ncbi:MAG: general secretion pathway protein GspD, partial [Planctomycetes bacterium]|nr:general secretion pathway protein GspD [Planctomycetota bacterium]
DADAVGMLGDVQVEYIPELGVLILRGNQKDVQRVQKIIAAIEQQSLATAPAIEVVPMQHSNSESLATLITQIYGEVYEPRLGSLSITALVKPNAILFVGRTENIAAAMELVVKLDTEVAPEAQIKVFRLLHMPAVNAEQYLENFYGTTTATGQTTQGQATVRGLSTRVTVISDFRSNSLIVQASPRDLSEVAKLLEELDVESTPATIELRVFPLRNSLATDMQTVIRSALTAQGQTAQAGFQTQQFQTPTQTQTQNQTSRSVQIVGIDQKGNKIIESGILTDVTVTADVNANSLVVRAPARSMGLVAELIEQLDKVPAAESQIKVFQIANGDATNLASMLQTLFGQQVTTGSIGAFSQTFGRTFGTGAGLVQSTAGESSLIPLNFGVDARTNSIVVSGSAEDLAVVEAILLRLDEGDLRQRQLTVYRLNNAPAQYVSDALTQILTEQQNLLRQQQSQVFSLISQFEVIDQQVFVVPEVISNTLIVSALPKYYEQITKVIEDLDRRPPMIMIQVVVALMRLDEGEEFGAELGIQDSLLFDRGIVGTTLTPGFNFANSPLGNSGSAQSLATREMLAGQAFGAFNMGRSSASEGFPGLVLSAGSESLSVLIRALAKKSRVQILSRPQIMTMNNIPASVLIGQRVPQITDFQTTNVGTVNSVDLIEVGVSLGVIPRVTPDGLIIMDIEARDSKVGDPSEGIPIGVQDGIAINSPIFDDITAITTIAARSGQTVVFGGLIASERTEAFRGVPYLSQIPIVGHLFRYDTKSDERRELIFFLTPHIVLGSEEIETINQRESQRMSWCLADVVNVHGDPGFAASGTDCWGQGTPVIYPHLDPTAEGAVMLDSAEPIPHPSGRSVTLPPQGRSLVLPPSEGREGAPFILPPEQRTEGKPFVLPPDQHTEGEPFILPPEQRTPGKPFVEPQP